MIMAKNAKNLDECNIEGRKMMVENGIFH